MALGCATIGQAESLSPAQWPGDERARVEALEQSPLPPRSRYVEGKFGLVSATVSPIAVHAGIEALKQGGTAADAAVTVALTQVTTALGSYVSYAGVLQLVYYDAKTDKVHSMNAGWGSYQGETEPATIPTANDLGAGQGRKTLVPGFMAGIESMHRRFGVLPFADLFAPAIWYSENGINVSPLLRSFLSSRKSYLNRTPEGKAFLDQASGVSFFPDQRFVQPEVAKVLRAVSRHGAQIMYTGEWGREYVAAVQHAGGKVTREDLQRYQPIWEEPVSTEFAGHTVFGPGRSSRGGYNVMEALNLIEAYKIEQMAPYWKDPKTFQALSHVLELTIMSPYIHSQIASAALKDGLNFSPQDRATKAYAKAVFTYADPIIGSFDKPKTTNHSDAIVIVDRWGNIACLTHSINTVLWGTTGIVVRGIPVSDAACFQQQALARLTPGDPVPNDIAPIIVMTAGKPSLAITSIGAALQPETIRILLGLLGNHLDAPTVMAAPPMLLNANYRVRGMVQVPEGGYDKEFISSLTAAGLVVRTVPTGEMRGIKGTAVIATLSAESGLRQSVEDTGIFSFADGY
jgi:gamma-glutamyltranspeptidase/glutathione hydrolase